MAKIMTDEQKEKMKEARDLKAESRFYVKFDNIIIKSYENGWMLYIGNEDTRYYSELSTLFKKLFSIKLSRKRVDALQAIESAQKDVLNEVKEIALRLEEAINNKNMGL